MTEFDFEAEQTRLNGISPGQQQFLDKRSWADLAACRSQALHLIARRLQASQLDTRVGGNTAFPLTPFCTEPNLCLDIAAHIADAYTGMAVVLITHLDPRRVLLAHFEWDLPRIEHRRSDKAQFTQIPLSSGASRPALDVIDSALLYWAGEGRALLAAVYLSRRMQFTATIPSELPYYVARTGQVATHNIEHTCTGDDRWWVVNLQMSEDFRISNGRRPNRPYPDTYGL